MSKLSAFENLSSAVADAAALVAPGIVEVASHRSLSSGFVWREGLIVTADEALADEGKIAVEFSDGSQLRAQLVGRDPTTDVALLRIEGVATNPLELTGEIPRPGSLTLVAAAAESAPLLFTANDCLDIGIAFGSPVALDYAEKAPFKFNGTIDSVHVAYV